MRKYRKRNKRYLLFSAFIMLLGISLFLLYEMRIRPIISQVAVARAKSMAVSIINDEVNRIIVDSDISYNRLQKVETDGENRVCAVIANVAEISRLKARIALGVQEKMQSTDAMTMRIPIGTLLSDGLFSGYGPKIPIRFTSIGRAVVDIGDSFQDAGINQTRHEMHLAVSANVNVLLPGGNEGAEIHTVIPIAQSVIVGMVPENFAQVVGVNEDTKEDILNIIE